VGLNAVRVNIVITYDESVFLLQHLIVTSLDMSKRHAANTKGKGKIAMDKRTLIVLRTSDIAFNNTELTFIRKYLHCKYPSAMSRMIDQTRLLMRAIQSTAKPNSKLMYSAERAHPENTDRYVVTEMLYDINEAGNRAMISIEPIADRTNEVKDLKIAAKTLRRVFTELSDTTAFPKDARLLTCGVINYRFVLQQLLEYLESIKQEIIVHEYSFVTQLDQEPHLFLDLRHKHGRSHHIKMRFDFFEQTAPVQAEEKISEVAEQ